MGFNHAQLGKMLCPAKYLDDYSKDPIGMKNKFDSASLKVTSALWPAYLYPGDIPGNDFDPEDIIEGLFRGYLLERVTKHIFTSPSSALKVGVSSGTRACNAKLHGMTRVEAEHIAYAAVQACFAISSLDKWKDKDALFHYPDYYTRIINLIRGRKDAAWVDSLLAYYNEQLFGNENGAKPTDSTNTECSEDDDMIMMERQLAARAARASGTSNATSTQSLAADNPQESHPQPSSSASSVPPAPPAPPVPASSAPPAPPALPVPSRSSTPDPPIDSRK
ncbi:hypothetical protein EV702DRAFT_1231094, partial [Suillus placidus]